MTSTTNPTAILAIRPAVADDAPVLTRLAALDSADVPTGDVLLGVVDGRPLAALAIADGTVVADPFATTADILALLRQRGDRLRAPAPRRRRGATVAGLLRRGSPRLA